VSVDDQAITLSTGVRWRIIQVATRATRVEYSPLPLPAIGLWVFGAPPVSTSVAERFYYPMKLLLPGEGFCGTMRVITTLEFLQHLFAKLGHRDLLNFCDPTYLNPSQLLTHEHAVASAAPAASYKSRLHQQLSIAARAKPVGGPYRHAELLDKYSDRNFPLRSFHSELTAFCTRQPAQGTAPILSPTITELWLLPATASLAISSSPFDPKSTPFCWLGSCESL